MAAGAIQTSCDRQGYQACHKALFHFGFDFYEKERQNLSIGIQPKSLIANPKQSKWAALSSSPFYDCEQVMRVVPYQAIP